MPGSDRRKPLLGHWLKKLEMSGCDSVLINTHYLVDQVENFLETHGKAQRHEDPNYLRARITGHRRDPSSQPKIFEGETGLLIHADNVMQGDMNDFIVVAHHQRQASCLQPC